MRICMCALTDCAHTQAHRLSNRVCIDGLVDNIRKSHQPHLRRICPRFSNIRGRERERKRKRGREGGRERAHRPRWRWRRWAAAQNSLRRPPSGPAPHAQAIICTHVHALVHVCVCVHAVVFGRMHIMFAQMRCMRVQITLDTQQEIGKKRSSTRTTPCIHVSVQRSSCAFRVLVLRFAPAPD